MKLAGRFEIPDSLAKMTAADMTPEEVIAGGYFEAYRPWSDLAKGVGLALLGKVGARTPQRDIDRVYRRMKVYIETTPLDGVADADVRRKKAMDKFKRIWPVLRHKLYYNPGMTDLMLDYGCQSWFTLPIITTGAQAILLELFDGRTKGMDGEFCYIPYGDPASLIMVCEPIGVEIRARRDYAQRVLAEESRLNVVMYGAGVCAEVRRRNLEWERNGITWQGLKHRTCAIERDARNLKNLEYVFDDPKRLADDYGIDYNIADMFEFSNDPANSERFDIGLAMGVLSYFRRDLKSTLEALMKPIRNGGRLVCDFQLIEGGILHDAYCKGWKSNLRPDLSPKLAIYSMSRVCHELGFGMSYETVRHPFAKASPGVLFTIYK